MQKIILNIKDDKKTNFLIELLKQFDFVEIEKSSQKQDENYDFFASAGLWKNREINAEKLRKQAWQRNH
ncbi:MAG TPA: hypothetical protein VF181_02245 [Balneolaceae bacterium]